MSSYDEGEDGGADLEVNYAGVKMTWLYKNIKKNAMRAHLQVRMKSKAATKIQKTFRGWKTRQQLKKLHESAVKIQKTWRGFLGRIRYYSILEATINRRIVEHYHRSATEIQHIYRGYHTRKYVHNQPALKQLQIEAASEVLRCVAIKTRQLLMNQQIPGVYSLRNSKCLTKVEKLLTSLRLERYNENIRQERVVELNKLTKAFEKSMKSGERIELPFGKLCDGDPHRKRTSLAFDNQLHYYNLRDDATRESNISSDLSFELYKHRRRSSECTNKI